MEDPPLKEPLVQKYLFGEKRAPTSLAEYTFVGCVHSSHQNYSTWDGSFICSLLFPFSYPSYRTSSALPYPHCPLGPWRWWMGPSEQRLPGCHPGLPGRRRRRIPTRSHPVFNVGTWPGHIHTTLDAWSSYPHINISSYPLINNCPQNII